jgi:hypothetical protein
MRASVTLNGFPNEALKAVKRDTAFKELPQRAAPTAIV